jgi:hypothetical protein
MIDPGKLGERFLTSWGSRAAVEREDQTVINVLVIVRREVQQERPLCAIGYNEIDLVALSSATLLHLGVEGFATASAGPGVGLAEKEAQAKHAKVKKSD